MDNPPDVNVFPVGKNGIPFSVAIIPQIILVIGSNEDPPVSPQTCKEQQEVLERENQSLKQAPGVKGYAQHGGLPAVF